jgi:hypothetical protein
MRLSPVLAFLPAIAAAADQVPLGASVTNWFNKAKSFVSGGGASPGPVVEKVAEVVANQHITYLNNSNWQSVLSLKSEPQTWFIYVTGGNKTCFGRCERADKEFDVGFSIAVLTSPPIK